MPESGRCQIGTRVRGAVAARSIQREGAKYTSEWCIYIRYGFLTSSRLRTARKMGRECGARAAPCEWLRPANPRNLLRIWLPAAVLTVQTEQMPDAVVA